MVFRVRSLFGIWETHASRTCLTTSSLNKCNDLKLANYTFRCDILSNFQFCTVLPTCVMQLLPILERYWAKFTSNCWVFVQLCNIEHWFSFEDKMLYLAISKFIPLEFPTLWWAAMCYSIHCVNHTKFWLIFINICDQFTKLLSEIQPHV